MHSTEDDVPPPPQRKLFTLSFHNIFMEDGLNSPILNNISGSFSSGRMACIVGPSGGGKSSLLNAISGYRKAGVTGQLCLDGKPVANQRKQQLISYIPQNAQLLLNLTAEESMTFAADFKLPSNLSKDQKIVKTKQLLKLMGLEKSSKTLVKDLSGGERKRLSIGVNLLTDSQVMLLDEPTSGLDSVSAYQVLSYIRDINQLRGNVIVCVIHQPSSNLLRLFDDMFVLSRGRRMYCGPVDEFVERLGELGLECPKTHNPADYALEIASSDHDDEKLELLWAAEDQVSSHGSFLFQEDSCRDPSSNFPQNYVLNSGTQTMVLLNRTLRCTLRDIYNLKARIAISTVIAILIGITFYDTGNDAARILSNTSALTLFTFSTYFQCSFSAILTFPKESAIFLQEHKSNWYSLGPYYFSKMIVEIPILIASVTLPLLIMFYLTSQPLQLHRILAMWVAIVLSGWVTLLIGLVLGAIYSMQTAVFGTILAAIISGVFSGFFVTLRDIWWLMKPLTFLSWARYGLEGVLNAVYGFDRESMECREIFCYFTLKKFVTLFGMPEIDWVYDMLALAGMALVLHVMLYYCLWRRIKKDV